MLKVACFLVHEQYKAGDPAPIGYLQQSEWAEVQLKAGLRQRECGRCGKWKFPQELSGMMDTCQAYTRRRGGLRLTLKSPVCLLCAKSE
jgi:hypothetical protein